MSFHENGTNFLYFKMLLLQHLPSKTMTRSVHIVKKTKKWTCKICNSKQSIQKVYGQGSAKDCRLHVQKWNKLNETRCYPSEEYAVMQDTSEKDSHEFYDYEDENLSCSRQNEWISNEFDGTEGTGNSKRSKWDVYLDKDVESTNEKASSLIASNNEKRIDHNNAEKIDEPYQHFQHFNKDGNVNVYSGDDELKLVTSIDVSKDGKWKENILKYEHKFGNHEKSFTKVGAFRNENQTEKIQDSATKSKSSETMKLFKFGNSTDENDIDDILSI